MLTGNLIAAQILDLGRDPTVEKLQKMLNGLDAYILHKAHGAVGNTKALP